MVISVISNIDLIKDQILRKILNKIGYLLFTSQQKDNNLSIIIKILIFYLQIISNLNDF